MTIAGEKPEATPMGCGATGGAAPLARNSGGNRAVLGDEGPHLHEAWRMLLTQYTTSVAAFAHDATARHHHHHHDQ